MAIYVRPDLEGAQALWDEVVGMTNEQRVKNVDDLLTRFTAKRDELVADEKSVTRSVDSEQRNAWIYVINLVIHDLDIIKPK